MAPALTPRPIVDKIAVHLISAVKDPGFSARLTDFGVDPLGNRPEEYRAMLEKDIVTWAQAVEAAGCCSALIA